MTRQIAIRDAANGLDVRAVLLDDKAPANAAFLWAWAEAPRPVPAIHAMWTGPEISCPIPPAQLAGQGWATALPPENATLHPQPGDVVLALGFPWGVMGGATTGIVIGAGAALPELGGSGREWIAASLHLRPGHSGGPMVDAAGRHAGISTMMNGPDVGVAIPAHVAAAFLKRALAA